MGYALFGLAILVVLLCTLLGGMLAGVLFSLPFWACGAVCFLFQKRVGLWCAWTAFFFADTFLRFATGIAWGGIRFLIMQFTYASPLRGMVSLGMTALIAGLLFWTVWSFRDKILEPDRRAKIRLLCLVLVIVLTAAAPWAVSYFGQQVASDGQSLYLFTRVSQVLGTVTQWLKIFALSRLVIDLLAVRRWKKAQDEQ